MMRGTIVRVSVALAGAALLVSACGGGSSVDESAATAESFASTEASSPTSSEAPSATDAADAADAAVSDATSAAPSSISSAGGATSTGGDQPTFTWEPVDGATLYSVVVTTADGSAFWAWQGSETTATVGDGAPDPLVSADMTWSVVALSDAGDGLWESGPLPV